ncbi:MAG: efflux RND transporter periplasmic adaptor subunit [Spirochaetes bacterium]|nr:efflux RND transporter periplasmic adaptor subunit [Spirochaetota bacterium]
MSKWKKLLLALIFIIVGSVASYRIGEIVVTRIFPHKTKTPSHTLTENPEYLTIELKDSVHSIDALGQIVYGEKVNISSKVEGRLEKIYVREGSRVTKGQLLAEIERLTLELTLKQQQSELDISQKSFELAKAKLENAIKAIEIKLAQIRKARADVHDKKITYENSLRTLTNKTELFTIGGISESELEAIKTQHTTHHTRYLNAKADLEIQEVGFRDTDIAAAGFEIPNSEEAKIELFKTINTKIEKAEVDAALSKINQVTQIIESTKKLIQETYIRAPISGIVALKNMEVGEIVKRDSIIATVIDISSVFLSLNVGETEVKHIREGQNVLFTADAFHNEEFRGKIARIVPVLDSKTRTFEIKALVPNSDMRLLPGMFARAKIIIEKKENAILIPAHALITRSENEGEILLVKKQIPFRHKIKLGKEFGDHVEVIEGLSRGDVIVSKQARALLQGAIAEK